MPEHYVIVDGLAVPQRLGGHPAVDFCNTWAGWDGRDAKEYLASYDHLATWAGFVELLDAARVQALRAEAARRPRAAGQALAHARVTRERIYRALACAGAIDAITQLAPDIRRATDRLVLHGDGDAPRFEIDAGGGLAIPLLATLWSAGQLLVSSDRARVRVCPGPGCGWLFLDRSGRRRWCTMTTCGNREKARRFANRRRPNVGHE
ncbi:MAG: CGNR zinc finger domain-containing protein [Solirubrobacteraceae bacterium]